MRIRSDGLGACQQPAEEVATSSAGVAYLGLDHGHQAKGISFRREIQLGQHLAGKDCPSFLRMGVIVPTPSYISRTMGA